MRKGRLYLLRDVSRTLLLDSVMRTASSWERMRGLLWRPPLLAGEALIIDRCGSVHTCGMKYALDLVFLDRESVIRKLVRAVRPWRMAGCIAADTTLEMPAGSIDRLKLEPGMQLLWQESASR
jgi:uncharacterized membrane protein (UPF0127 family)